MKPRVLIISALGALALMASFGAQAQSTYSNVVMALNPAAYWPLAESSAPSPAGLYIATNLGTLGTAGQGYYETWWQTNSVSYTLTNLNSISHLPAGSPVIQSIAGDPNTGILAGQTNDFVVIPRNTNGVPNAGVTLSAPFTIEFWVYPTNFASGLLKPILTEGFNSVQATNSGYVTLGQGASEGTTIGMYGGDIYFNTFNGATSGSKTEIDTATLSTTPQWYHYVAMFDGTNMSVYTNGVAVKTGVKPPNNYQGVNYVPDPVSPLVIGGGNELGLSSGANVPFGGAIADVAIYNYVLASTQITNHYRIGTNSVPPTNYVQVVQGDNPTIFLRLNEPAYVGPSATTGPVANNYGSLGTAANGYYLSGATPGVAGPAYAGFGAGSSAVALNGFNSVVDVGGGNLPSALNRTNGQPESVTAWVKGNPADCVARFQSILSHGPASWQVNLDNNACVQFNPGNGPALTFTSVYDELNDGVYVNDGNWHFVAAVCDGNNDALYIDGRLMKSGTGAGLVTGNLQDLILGGDPQYLAPLNVGNAAPGGRAFDGCLSQVAIFTNALSASQIQGIYGAAGVPPFIISQPAAQIELTPGIRGTVPTVVGGSSPNFQWYYQGGGAVTGQTASSLTFNPVSVGSVGSYYLIATNNYGAVTSSVVVVQVSSFQAGTYAYAVAQLNPVAYWPLNETTPPPAGQYIATNSGTLGAMANGYYQSWYQPVAFTTTNDGTITSITTYYATNNIQRIAGGTTNSPDPGLVCGFTNGLGQYVVIPRTTNGLPNAATTIASPFSLEAWVKTTNSSSTLRPIINEGRNEVQDGAANHYTNSLYGFSLGQYSGYFYFQVYNGVQSLNGGSAEVDSGPTTASSLVLNAWYHIVVTYDGSTISMYTNGVLSAAKGQSSYAVDLTSPLLIGTGTELSTGNGGDGFSGAISDVAIYNQALNATQVANHWNAGTNGAQNYVNTVQGDSPTIFLRLNEPAFTSYPSPSTYPIATNYGTLGGSANGYYQPGTTPGVAGPTYPGFGASTAVAINGFFGGVDIGGGVTPAALNPLGLQPQTVAAWFQANPADPRFQEIVSRGDSSWRLALNGYNGGTSGNSSTAPFDLHYNPGNNPADLGFTNGNEVAANDFMVNDGNWHFGVGVADGTNAYLYIDGVLAKKTNVVSSLAGTTLDALIGGSPAHTTSSEYANNVNSVRYFDGQIAQVAYFTNALSAVQISQIYGAAGVPLSISQEPALATTNNTGTAVTITFGVRGSLPIYQWYSSNINTTVVSPVAGQTNANLVFNPAVLGNSGYYFSIATNAYSSVTSSVAQLVVVGPPLILAQSPTNIEVFAGTAPALQVTAQGPGTLVFQWSSNGVVLAGATGTAYSPSTAVLGTNVYTCIVTNTYGAATNSAISFAVIADPTAPFPERVLADGPVAYYRLDEASGTTAYDYAGGNNATYTNVDLGMSGYTSEDSVNSDPTETAAGFGFISPPNDYAGNVPSYLNFGTPSGSNAEFSVEAWVTQYEYENSGDCIVGLGYGNGGEQFVLDTGNLAAGDLRFFVRNAAGTGATANSTNHLVNDGLWHHVVGVCDEAGGHVYLYLDGNQVGSATITPGSGLLSSSVPLSIGARQSGNNGGTNYDFQLYGSVDDVAVYNKALSSSQVQAHYYASGIVPVITGLTPSSNWTTNETASVVFSVTASGTAPLSYQWTDNNGNPIPWGTNATLVLTNVLVSQAGTYTVYVTNYYGGPATTNVNLTVTEVPQLVADITPLNAIVYALSPVTLSAVFSGTPPLSYQWYLNGAAIPNATNTSYTFPAVLGTNSYYVSVTNIYSAGTPTVSSTATVVGMPSSTLNPTNYTDHLQITFAGYNRSETLADFPVLVRLSTALTGFNYNHFASPTGGDLRFTDGGGIRIIPSEIDQWDLNGESTVWVQVPALSGTNTSIWAYWGNPTNTTPLPGTNVWVPQPWEGLPSFDVVYHLKESGFPYADSTSQSPALTGVAPTPVMGIVGTGEDFNASYLDAGTNNVGNQFTVSAWVNVATNASSIQGIWASKAGGNSSGFACYVNFYNTSDQELVLETGNGNNSTPTLRSPDGLVSSNRWHYVTEVIDRGDAFASLYVDGVAVAGTGSIRNDFATNNDINLGQYIGGFPFHGILDEARIQSGTNSANWVWASYETVAQTAALESYSAIASTAPATPVAIEAKYTAGGLNISGTGGTPNATYYIIGSTNLATPVLEWLPLYTNAFDMYGNFNFNVPVSVAKPTLFLRIKQ